MSDCVLSERMTKCSAGHSHRSIVEQLLYSDILNAERQSGFLEQRCQTVAVYLEDRDTSNIGFQHIISVPSPLEVRSIGPVLVLVLPATALSNVRVPSEFTR